MTDPPTPFIMRPSVKLASRVDSSSLTRQRGTSLRNFGPIPPRQ
jgi:hypothetical protein